MMEDWKTQDNAVISDPGTLPAWKTELSKRPLVELRRGFSLGYDAPSEDSSTIALTAPSGRYVDIRFSTLPQTSSDNAVTKQMGKIHGYATAGMSKVVFPKKPESNCPPYEFLAYVEWVHTIDSSNTFDTGGADMILLPDGCRMEVGFLEIRGTVKYFKEYWIIPADRETSLPCVVAELDSSAHDAIGGASVGHGMAIRIGDFCQGILQTDKDFWYERWEYKNGKDGKGWIKDSRSNTPQTASILPCWQLTESRQECGSSFELADRIWTVTEAMY